MSGVDPYLVVYIISGVILVAITYIFLSIVTDGVRSFQEKLKEEEKKKKEAEKKRRMAG